MLNQEIMSDYYPETVGMATLILGKAFSGFDDAAFSCFGALSVGAGDGAAFGCFGALSVGTGEGVRGRLDDCPVGAVTLSGMLAGSWAC